MLNINHGLLYVPFSSKYRVKFDGLERAIPSKAKAFSAPCTKVHNFTVKFLHDLWASQILYLLISV
jgi:hypothetical protein